MQFIANFIALTLALLASSIYAQLPPSTVSQPSLFRLTSLEAHLLLCRPSLFAARKTE